MRAAIAAVLCVAVTGPAYAESISFEAYELQAGGRRKLLAQGTRDYSPASDVTVIDEGPSAHGGHWSKRLTLFGAYELEAEVYQELQLDGFGLVINERGNPKGFSWEWFDREQADVFNKRQGAGRLKVTVVKSKAVVELVAVEFLDDVTLRYVNDRRATQRHEHTHEIVIKKGSIFRVPPGRPAG